MQDTIFQWGGASFTVRPATIRSIMARNLLLWALQESGAGQGDPVGTLLRFHFANAVSQTIIEGEPEGWVPPDDYTDPEAVRTSFNAWGALPPALYELWIPALDAANAPVVAPEYGPEPPEKKAGD